MNIAVFGSFFQSWNPAGFPNFDFRRGPSPLADTRGRSIASNKFGYLDFAHYFKTLVLVFSGKNSCTTPFSS